MLPFQKENAYFPSSIMACCTAPCHSPCDSLGLVAVTCTFKVLALPKRWWSDPCLSRYLLMDLVELFQRPALIAPSKAAAHLKGRSHSMPCAEVATVGELQVPATTQQQQPEAGWWWCWATAGEVSGPADCCKS